MKNSILATFLAISLSFSVPFSASAVEYDYLLNDIKELEKELQMDMLDEQTSVAEDSYESKTELFPRDRDTDSKYTIRADEISSTHVYVRENGIPFILEDVPLDEWFALYVRDMGDKGIITGYRDNNGNLLGKFGPADNITLQQLAKIAVIASGKDQAKCPQVTSNASASGSWAQVYVACAEYYRWSAFTDTQLDTSRIALRAEVVTTILEAFDVDFDSTSGGVFKDVSASFPMRAPIETAFSAGIVSGYTDEKGNDTGFFGPFDAVTRAATAKIVSLAMQVYVR